MGPFVVYVIRCAVNGKCYVGKTGRPRFRWYVHKSVAKQQAGKRAGEAMLYRAMRKHGISSFSFEIVETCCDEAQSFDRERAWIADLRSFGPHGYNMSAGGEGQSGFKHPEASKLRMARHGKDNGCFGRVWTADERTAHAARSRKQFAERGHPWSGRKHSEETRAKLSVAAAGNKRCVGRPCSDETRAKKSRAMLGREPWNKGKETGPQSESRRAKQAIAMRAYWSRRKAGD